MSSLRRAPAANRLSERIESTIGTILSPIIANVAAFNRWRLPPLDAPHPLLTGVHQPMTEELTLEELAVSGAIPRELDGRYVRIGPNPAAPDPRTYHFFIGDGMLHGVRLRDGRALWYRNRWIRSTEVAKARGVTAAAGAAARLRHGQHQRARPCGVRLGPGGGGQHAGALRRGPGGAALRGFRGARCRAPSPLIRGATLTPANSTPCATRRPIPNVCATTWSIRAGGVRRSVTLPVEHGPLIHDCAITGRYVVILDLPLTLSMRVVLAGHGFPYRWNDKHPARIGLLPREGEADAIRWLPIEPCFVFHNANAYDLADGRVVLDVIAYDRMFADDNSGPDQQPRGFERWVIDPEAATVTQTVIDAAPQELPVIDDRRTGRPYRYAYALGLPEHMSETLVGEAPLIKHDLEEGSKQVHDFGPGRLAGEFVFTPRQPDAAEDDGWLMGLVIEADGRSTALEILDARDMAAPPVAVIRIPHRVPPGIHGAWLPAGRP